MIFSKSSRPIRRVILTAVALLVWFYTQSLIGARPLPASGIEDGLHRLTAPLNSYFLVHAGAANALLIVSSGLIDLLAFFLLLRWLFGSSVRPFLGLFLLMVMRQIVQAFCALPAPPNMIWHYPGFPSLLVTYSVAGDFFFSGHTAIAMLAIDTGTVAASASRPSHAPCTADSRTRSTNATASASEIGRAHELFT